MNACLKPFLLTPLFLFLTGCVDTELRISNQCGTGIHVYSGHTKKVKAISPGAIGIVPHTSGKVVIITQRNEVWEYENVDTRGIEATKRYKRVCLEVSLGSDGVMSLPSGKSLNPIVRETP